MASDAGCTPTQGHVRSAINLDRFLLILLKRNSVYDAQGNIQWVKKSVGKRTYLITSHLFTETIQPIRNCFLGGKRSGFSVFHLNLCFDSLVEQMFWQSKTFPREKPSTWKSY